MCVHAAVLAIAFTLTLPLAAAGQSSLTGNMRGQVVDPHGLPVPGALVTVASPALQGKQSTVTSTNGDFFIPFLPRGEYIVACERSGFQHQTYAVSVTASETRTVLIKLALAATVAATEVRGTPSPEISETATLATAYDAVRLERLPVGRTLNDAVLLAPGVTPNRVNNNPVISGALSYENLYLVDGIVLNGAILGAPLPLYVEEAIQETRISIAAVSAEYGRFQGGVVNMVTKAGGNTPSGSFRVTLTDDLWRARTPYPADQKVHALTPALEITAGGPIRKNRLWLFGAARYTEPARNVTLPFTHANYTVTTRDKRGEGKLTFTPISGHSLRSSYVGRALNVDNNTFGTVMDLASLYDDATDFSLAALNYTGVLGNRTFVEAQYSSKREVITGRGSRFSELVRGTPILDRSRGLVRFNSPAFCNVCGGGWLEHHDNWAWLVKTGYFLSSRTAGSHSLTFGGEIFEETRQNNNWQSGSGFEIEATGAVIEGSIVYPVFASDSTFINYLPLVAESRGNDIRTYSHLRTTRGASTSISQ